MTKYQVDYIIDDIRESEAFEASVVSYGSHYLQFLDKEKDEIIFSVPHDRVAKFARVLES